jgi:murein DD-endopeptidase MepM/ murein hydrolase activator NlpD
MRKAFLRMPVSFARISSRFNLRRKHPILNKIRAHKGVDYVAPMGTPMKAAGDGKIIFRNRKGGYGKTIILQHGNKYTTLYAHLSRYARHLKEGSRVKQGQIIGYIGKSGLATGPHLHYEFRVNGIHRNPLTVKLPAANPLPKADLAEFTSTIQPLLAQLASKRHEQIATQ